MATKQPELAATATADNAAGESVAPTLTGAPTSSAEPEGGSGSIGALAPSHEFTAFGGRFQMRGRLGEGGMGCVYEVFDAQRGSSLALKTLSRIDPSGIYRFKNEFRSLADLRHPNLVELHELFCDSNGWFFTMELVNGMPLDDWLRGDDTASGGEDRTLVDETRLRSALRQLVEAIAAIHAAGKLHRDLKPSNVLVTPEGRVVVLDFGIAAEAQPGGIGQTIADEDVSGTPGYMAPEQAAGHQATTASDMYALGVMLFEALTGTLPFQGSAGEIRAVKQRLDAPLLRAEQGSDLPTDLATLCDGLLARDPSARPTAAALLGPQWGLGATAASVLTPAVNRNLLLGRSHELEALQAAYAAATEGHLVVVAVEGESGIGKTALCQAFMAETRAARRPLVLSGRCYEQERIPFKAIDPLVDDLSRYLRRLKPEQAAALLPRDTFALAKLFPVLARIGVVRAAASLSTALNERELQRAAFASFRELLGRVCARRPLIVFMDDMQWMDADSGKLLRFILIARANIPALFITTYRTEDSQSNPALRSLLETTQTMRTLDFRRLRLSPLMQADTKMLARLHLGAAPPAADAYDARIAGESGGNPFFALELARFMRSGLATASGRDDMPMLSLSVVIVTRVQALPQAARNLLQVLAIAGRPIGLAVVLRAAGATHADGDLLRQSHLARGIQEGGQQRLDCYHDRVREVIAGSLSETQRTAHHGGLAAALQDDADADLELLSRCLEVCGERERSAHCAQLAATQAAAAMAFDHAASLYRRALALGSSSTAWRLEIGMRLGQVLENAGLGSEAARAYQDAASLTEGEARLDLLRRAAEQLLSTGHLQDGTVLLRSVCAELDIHLPQSLFAAQLSLGLGRLKLARRLRVARIGEQAGNAATGYEALRLSTARTAVTGLIGYLPVHSASVAANYLMLALRSGDVPHRVRGIGFHAEVQSLLDPTSSGVAVSLASMDALVIGHPNPELEGFSSLMKGTSAYHREACREARGHLARARTTLRECTGVEWELDAINVYDQICAYYCGDHAELARTTPVLIDEAMRRGRVWAAVMLSGFAGLPAWILPGDLEGYRSQLAVARKHWKPGARLGWPDYMLLMGEALLTIYSGDAATGYDRLEACHAAYCGSMLTRKAAVAMTGYALHQGACSAAALRAAGPRPGRARRRQLRATLQSSIATMRRHGLARMLGIAEALEAALHFDQGADQLGIGHLRHAIARLEAVDIGIHAAATRRRLGQWLGGDTGDAIRESGEAFMRRQGVRELEPATELHCPGCAPRAGAT